MRLRPGKPPSSDTHLCTRTGLQMGKERFPRRRFQPLAGCRMPLDAPPPRDSRFGSPLTLSRAHWVRRVASDARVQSRGRARPPSSGLRQSTPVTSPAKPCPSCLIDTLKRIPRSYCRSRVASRQILAQGAPECYAQITFLILQRHRRRGRRRLYLGSCAASLVLVSLTVSSRFSTTMPPVTKRSRRSKG